MGLCTNNEDLEWCQNGQKILTSVENESLPYENFWKPLDKHSECSLSYSSKVVSSHQQIETANKRDRLAYHCFNRADETPFHKAINTDALEKIENNWIELVNTPCESPYYRRCLGKAAKECTGK